MAQNYEVFLADKPLLICQKHVENPVGPELEIAPSTTDMAAVVNRIYQEDCQGLKLICSDADLVWQKFQSAFKLMHAAGGLVTDQEGRVLAIHRMGRWDLPKGKLERGEDPTSAAVREVEEECGITDLQLKDHLITTWHGYLHKGSHILKRTDWYEMFVDSTDKELTPQEEEDIDRVEWLDEDGVRVLMDDTYSSIRRVVEKWMINRPTL